MTTDELDDESTEDTTTPLERMKAALIDEREDGSLLESAAALALLRCCDLVSDDDNAYEQLANDIAGLQNTLSAWVSVLGQIANGEDVELPYVS